MKIAFRLFRLFFIIAVFVSGIYFSVPFLSSSLRDSWAGSEGFFLFMLSLTGFTLVLFFVSAMAGLMED